MYVVNETIPDNKIEGDITCTIPLNTIADLHTYLCKLNVRMSMYANLSVFYHIPNAFKVMFDDVEPSWKYHFKHIKCFVRAKIYLNAHFMINPKHPRRLMSLTEVLGRLCCCGFSIVDIKHKFETINIVVQKKSLPLRYTAPKYHFFIGLPRIGQKGKLFSLYKIRTMYPFASYLQDMIYTHHGLTYQHGIKFKSDYRISYSGKIIRKYWLDELPSLINMIKGNLKLVGLRSYSSQFLSLLPSEHVKYRQNFKPGLIPPTYTDNPHSVSALIKSEMKYLMAYQKKPILTNWKYFWLFIYIFFIKGKHSA